jgi:DNA-binding NarL/FixJ family response regulator
VRQLRALLPAAGIVLISMEDTGEVRDQARDAGADLFVPKWDILDVLPAAIQAAAALCRRRRQTGSSGE